MPTVSYSRLNDFWRCRDNVPPVLFTGGHQLARVGPSGEPLMRAVGRLSRVKWVRQTKIASALLWVACTIGRIADRSNRDQATPPS